MQLVKITHDRVQIKSDSFQIADISLNDAILLTDYVSGVSIIGVVMTIGRGEDSEQFDCDGSVLEADSVSTIECSIVGSLHENHFTKSVDIYPTTNVKIEKISPELLKSMISGEKPDSLLIGKYAEYALPAYLDGNKFFQRHSALLGNTGSGKSVTVASILERISAKSNSNAIVFDVHGEYADLSYVKKIKIGNTGLAFPMWFLPFRDMYTSLLKIREETSSVQLSVLRRVFYNARKSTLGEELPVQYQMSDLIQLLEIENSSEIHTGEFFQTGTKAGQAKTVKGDYYGKLTGLVSVLVDKATDTRYRFMTSNQPQGYFNYFVDEILSTASSHIKVIDLSDVPHDMIPIIVGVTAKLIYSIQLLQDRESLVPLEIICDEAHVYIPYDSLGIGPSQRRILEIFETIAKEGRKFGTSLMVVSQRPSELNRTILSQCANFIVLKLSNDIDKQYIKSILPNGSKGAIEGVSLFSPGQCLVVGDSCEIMFKINIDLPSELPNSSTINTWSRWDAGSPINTPELAKKLLKETSCDE